MSPVGGRRPRLPLSSYAPSGGVLIILAVAVVYIAGTKLYDHGYGEGYTAAQWDAAGFLIVASKGSLPENKPQRPGVVLNLGLLDESGEPVPISGWVGTNDEHQLVKGADPYEDCWLTNDIGDRLSPPCIHAIQQIR